ncbi:MAG: hypothetical protein ACRCVX_11965, partial [Shewanella sp.]
MLDLWSREHYKSTIITFGQTLQDILSSHGDEPLSKWQGREVTIGIFSHTRPNAKGFLQQIKRECESNQVLREIFDDVLWSNPQKQSPKWSEDEGLIFKRKSNPKEATVEAWGVVDGQPTGKHFYILVYDDVVTKESVTTPEMIAKTTDSLALSYNLGAEGGFRRGIGTRYHFNDSYKTVIDRGTLKPRIYAATDNGAIDGNPVLLTDERLQEKRRDMGAYVFSCQMMQNPVADSSQGFDRSWLRHYKNASSEGMTRYLLVDPANGKKKNNDYTAAAVVGLGQDKNYYLLDLVRDRLNLTERTAMVMRLHRKWKPYKTRYEKYGLQSDVEHIKTVMDAQTYRFNIDEVGGGLSKIDRIRKLIPVFESGTFYLPERLSYTNYEGQTRDLIHDFIEEEYTAFPVPVHDDMLDVLARIFSDDDPLVWPQEKS